ncbi:MAG: Nucleoside-triphosphatase [Acetothermia bacterium 64_32]|nr:MAG: Nucleoside-triphosphatase [Acetothermia bacterium 64_32]HAF71490.1 NTPase [Candidatus Acetothermia bacterium]
MRIAVTGHPGVGKTTLVERVLGAVPLKAGGMITKEIRKVGRRVGFSVIDVGGGREGVLAHLHLTEGPRLGRYRVNLKDLEGIGAAAIERAVEECELVVVDEVGPMELKSPRFVAAVERALREAKNLLITVHRASNHHLAYRIRHTCDPFIRLTSGNRDAKVDEVIRLLSRSR